MGDHGIAVREGGRSAVPAALTRPLTAAGLRGRRALKRFLYGQMAVMQGLMIASGREQPLVRFTIEGDPPAIYLVFRIREDQVDGLTQRLGLPPHLVSTPIRCLPDDEPAHLLTLNVYRVSGLTNALRAEWSIYVADEDGIPRYLVVDARSSATSMDPIDIVTPASRVFHTRHGRRIITSIGDGPGTFDCTIDLPAEDDLPRVAPAPEWVSANDYIYWGNGICDRTYYDAAMADPDQRRLPGSSADIQDDTDWAVLVEPDPAHVLVFRSPISLVISPWENLDRLTPAQA